MRLEAAIRLVAGSMLILSFLLTWFMDPRWVWFSVFIALNLMQSAFTGWCPMMTLLKKLGMEN
ncbi:MULTISPECIES: YgaP family membrane protein [Pseudoalteromonas]|uniref:DUF2892 domain-containing protein n=2 Tax=Pseudoalteromonas TaxID=53246 RepID=A0A0F4QFB2_9GAMM|nr:MULTISPECIES: DUF2892 domain-containing protein [Pseudoalteromonas]KJZ05964.1 rhodanese [Pseudoalteromonas rubra]MCF2910967.1 DUF2892 domain-containing protein [Pseudoalteromonas sp. DL2-H2.2]MCG7537601.1 DUF2892 domain-containing protein [Pseudoalteromonas sp. OOF1S-7]QTL36306.1 DUF2892 domain-containing protein [Pseudoalteromonas viridis]RZM74957.1 DUF2892 domain-containing protein [Pseudoalteromonas rubra]